MRLGRKRGCRDRQEAALKVWYHNTSTITLLCHRQLKEFMLRTIYRILPVRITIVFFTQAMENLVACSHPSSNRPASTRPLSSPGTRHRNTFRPRVSHRRTSSAISAMITHRTQTNRRRPRSSRHRLQISSEAKQALLHRRNFRRSSTPSASSPNISISSINNTSIDNTSTTSNNCRNNIIILFRQRKSGTIFPRISR